MPREVYLLATIIIVGFAASAWYIVSHIEKLREKEEDKTLLEWTKSTQEDIKKLQQVVADNLQRSTQNLTDTLLKSSESLNQRLDKAAEVIGALKKEAGQFSEVSKSMRDLQAFLQSPKLRGNIGEQVLADLITQVFPKKAFHLQYTFKSGQKVDAAIRTDAGILPIDSKFPMENFQKMIGGDTEKERALAKKEFLKDVRHHLDDIAKKYILPEEGTMDFALMYVPSEPVYYEIVNVPELTDYARKKRVYPVSPTTLYAHLQMILLSFEGKKIETRAREIFRLLRAIQKDYEKVDSHLGTLGGHITNAYNKFSEVTNSFLGMGQKLSATERLEKSTEEEKLPLQEAK
jgi:DNA recombination protein RmuC